MIINESSNYCYRYTDQYYEVGDIIKGMDPSTRNINDIITDVYSDKCNYDFSHGYVYMVPYRQDNNFDTFNYCYKVEPIGPTFTGYDDCSLDRCNDNIMRRIKTSDISDKDIERVADKMSDTYINNHSEIQSIISYDCRVVSRYRLKVKVGD